MRKKEQPPPETLAGLRAESKKAHRKTMFLVCVMPAVTMLMRPPAPSLVTAEYYAKARNIPTMEVVAAIVENRVSPKGVQVGFHETPENWEDNLSHYLLMSNAVISPRSK